MKTIKKLSALLLILSICSFGKTWGQVDEGMYYLFFQADRIRPTSSDICKFTLTVTDSYNHTYQTFTKAHPWPNLWDKNEIVSFNSGVGDIESDLIQENRYLASRKISKLSAKTEKYWRNALTVCKPSSSHQNDILIDYSKTYIAERFTLYNPSIFDTYYSLTLYPRYINLFYFDEKGEHIPKNSEKTKHLLYNDEITIKASTGYHSNNYNWQYSYRSNNEKLNVSKAGSNGITFSGKDLFTEAEFVELAEAKTPIHIFIDCKTEQERQTMTLTPMMDAPHIIDVTANPPKCFNEGDGSITLTFDRQLYKHDANPLAHKGASQEKLYIAYKQHSEENIVLREDSILLQNQGLDSIAPGKFTATIRGLKAGNYDIGLYGMYITTSAFAVFPNPPSQDTINTYTEGKRHRTTVVIPNQTPLSISSYTVDSVNCHGGLDGKITVNMGGGGKKDYRGFLTQGSDTIKIISTQYYNPSLTFTELKAGNYTFTVEDNNGCRKDSNEFEIKQVFSVYEPNDSVYIFKDDIIIQEPRAKGASNGWIKIPYTGGAEPHRGRAIPIPDIITCKYKIIKSSLSDKIDTLYIYDIPAGRYSASIYDANYNAAFGMFKPVENYCACNESVTVTVTEPDLLQVKLSEYHYVTCHGDSDGKIKAVAKGGRPLENNIYKYKFEWFRYNSVSDSVALGQSDSIVHELMSGYYKVKVSDKYGTYVWSDVFHLEQPEPLTLSVQTLTGIHCSGELTGSLEATAAGGTPPYTYLWETNDTTSIISGLAEGNYVVGVRDSRYAENMEGHYCMTQSIGSILSPNPIELNASVRTLLCYNADDAEITLNVTGGVPPYTYLWENGSDKNLRTSLKSGTYSVTVSDSEGCFKNEEFVIENPKKIILDLGRKLTICKNQSLKLDANLDMPDLVYEWTNTKGRVLSNEATLNISEAGRYILTVTSSDGCIAEDEIQVHQSEDEVITDFIIPTTVAQGSKFYAVNITQSETDDFSWLFPDEVDVLEEEEDKTQLSFKETGTYTLGLTGAKGSCQVTVYKSIEVVDKNAIEEDESIEPFLKRFIVLPNPNDGNFDVIIELREESDFSLYLYNSFGNLVERKSLQKKTIDTQNYSLSGIEAGIYLLRFVSPHTTAILKVIIQ